MPRRCIGVRPRSDRSTRPPPGFGLKEQKPDAPDQPLRVSRRPARDFREINRQIALNLVREKQPISRADLARLMGMRPAAVSLLVNELLAPA